MENSWWIEKAHETQAFADNMPSFYNALKTIYAPSKSTLSPVQSADGSTIYKEKAEILSRWAEHFQALLNYQNPCDEELLNGLPNIPVIHNLGSPPQKHELLNAIKGLKDSKSCWGVP